MAGTKESHECKDEKVPKDLLSHREEGVAKLRGRGARVIGGAKFESNVAHDVPFEEGKKSEGRGVSRNELRKEKSLTGFPGRGQPSARLHAAGTGGGVNGFFRPNQTA